VRSALRPRGKKSCRSGLIQVEPIQCVDGGEIDWYRQELIAEAREYAMLVGPPMCEGAEVLHDRRTVGVENVGAVTMIAQAVARQGVVRVAGDVWSLVDDEHARIRLAGETLREGTSGESRSNDQVIVDQGEFPLLD
jgi:hypothetical protein